MQKYIDQSLNKYTIKIITFFVILFYFLVPISLSHHLMNMDMDMNEGMNMSMDSNCTYISTEDSLCNINIFNHMNIWKKISTFVPEGVYRIMLIAPVVFLVLIIVDLHINNLFLYVKRKKYKDILILYSELFSSGILNSKAF